MMKAGRERGGGRLSQHDKSDLRHGNEERISYPRTTIVLYGSSWGECGYCQGRRADLVERPLKESSQSYTILISNASLSPAWYEELINQGWRRSGPAIYKPCNWTSCCPLLALRLPVQDFSPSKSQRKLMRKLKKILNGRPPGEKERKQPIGSTSSVSQSSSSYSSASFVGEYPTASHPQHIQQKSLAIATPDKKKQKHHASSSSSQSQAKTRLETSEEGAGSVPLAQSLLIMQQKTIEESQVLELLAAWTREILPSFVSDHSLIPPTLAFKLRKPRSNQRRRGKQQTQQQIQERNVQFSTNATATTNQEHASKQTPTATTGAAESTSTCIWTAVSTIAAAIAGRSRGAIDKAQLVRDLAVGLRAKLESNQVSSSLIAKVGVHEASGQILVDLQVDDQSQTRQQTTQATAHLSGNPNGMHLSSTQDKSSPQNQNQQGKKMRSLSSSNRDVLLEWWNHEYPHGPELRDRTITVETMHAFESCLDPAVHQLYAQYQHKIHDDPDPFHDNLDEFLKSDNEFRGSNGELDDPWPVFWSRYPDSLPPDEVYGEKEEDLLQRNGRTSANSNTSSGSNNNNNNTNNNQHPHVLPQYPVWLKQLQQVLQREYCHLPTQRRLRLSHFVARFCEYYVVSHFSTTRQQLSVTAKSSSSHHNKGGVTAIPCCGTYHQHYRISGCLIAVGVSDILPQGFSSVYLFYNPSFAQQVFPIGKLSAMKEIEYCRDVLKLPYYYMGYYLHANSKMQYKTDYAPSQLLCPKTYVWVAAHEAIPRLLARSPQQYCASLVAEEEEAAARTTAPEQQQQDDNQLDDDMLSAIVENMSLNVHGNELQVRDLAEAGQAYLKPLLLPFCQQAGRKASLDCIIHMG